MTWLILGLVAFLGFHLLPAHTRLRSRLIAAMGEIGYRIFFSVMSVLTLVLLIWAYANAAFVEIWSPPSWTRHIAAVLMVLSFVVLMSAFFPGRIKRALKHPMLIAIKTWALAHLIANGDLASILLFGGFLAYAVVDRILIKQRGEFAALEVSAGARNDLIAVISGIALYAAFIFGLHEWLIGVPVLL